MTDRPPVINLSNGPVPDVEPVQVVEGNATDRLALNNGVAEIRSVVDLLEQAGILCCMVGEPALIYYGTRRVMADWPICVPTEKLTATTKLLEKNREILEPAGPSAIRRVRSIEHLFARFKFVGLALFFVVMSSQACNLPCKPENFEYSQTGIPYPKLHVYAQCLLDTLSYVDLDDLVDGMILTEEWGEANLDLQGFVDTKWGRWKADFTNNGKAPQDRIPMWCHKPPERRTIWVNAAAKEGKKSRQGLKYSELNETRFRKRGSKDPRLRKRDYC
ncbi:MAG: hypothetical protein Q9160_006975 [Pyrenula sp. 1 TL-2023]